MNIFKLSPFHPFKPIWIAEFTILFIVFVLLNFSILAWLKNESIRFLKHKCNNIMPTECKSESNFFDRLDGCINLLVLSHPRLSALLVTVFIIGVIEIVAKIHRKPALVEFDRGRKEQAHEACKKILGFRKHIPKSLLRAKRLCVVATELRELVRRVEKGDVPFETPAAYLTSPESEKFFKRATRSIKFFLKVVNGNVAWSRPLRAAIAFAVVLVSCSFSISAAFSTAASCKGAMVFFQFLEFFSLSFLTVLGIMIFAGFHDYNRFRYNFVDTRPFTEDERFIISLIAANRDVLLNGFCRNKFSSYAELGTEGKADAFVELHESLLPFADFDNKDNL